MLLRSIKQIISADIMLPRINIALSQKISSNTKNGGGDVIKKIVNQTRSDEIDQKQRFQSTKLEIDATDISEDINLQSQWASLEKRLLSRKPKVNKPAGRHNLNKSAWDHEHV